MAGPYSHYCESNGVVYFSGMIPVRGDGTAITDDVTAATELVFENMKDQLAHARLTFHDIVKVTVYLTDMAKFPKMNEVYARYMTDEYPARSTIGVAALPKGVPVEIEIICHRPA